MMQWIINKQIAVEAETPEEAVQKISEGKTISFNVTLRPQASQPVTGAKITGSAYQQTTTDAVPKLNG